MAKKVDWGIDSVKFMNVAADGAFPDFDASSGVTLSNLIVIDSFVKTEEANTNTDIEWEETNSKLRLPGSVGTKTIVFESNDLSEEQFKYFKGYKDGTGANAGYIVNDPKSNDTITQAMQLKTRAVGEFPARIHEYTPVLVETKENGTVGKNGLPNLTHTITRQPNYDASGAEIGGHRIKDVPVTT
ncbi:hypothetical protein JGH11_16230 [Dysgonomonas sp. Marseille-P4677]|uniref:hypothetical protein n=1 Tax=Dysgonomonas sp. Marseille-P4677 TaxID=2364790 RepID=UPI001912041B|nr:hypothetical protein [Dysgonomonas sp. Marseille-P4677]MBK5722425.1 hypothetical protein [Dysgonomonas sp. Marseille-P4677]